MRSNLAVRIVPAPDSDSLWFYIDAQTLLTEVATAVNTYEMQAGRISPHVVGISTNPYVVAKPMDWITAYVRMRNFRDNDFYLKVAGRVIRKWRGEKSGGHADGYYVSDVKLSGTTKTEGQIWSRQHGASYREFGKFMASCMTKGSEVAWSEDLANQMRKVLRNEVNLSAEISTSAGSALPLLASAMFLTEASRNNRAWLMAQIMLDSIGRQYNRISAASPNAKYYTWDRVLAHPERIDPGFRGNAPLDKPQKGPTGVIGKSPSGLGNLATKKDLAKVEGKLPASPLGSAHPGSNINVASYYIQKKEASLTIRWLEHVLSRRHPDYDVVFATWPDDEPLTGLTNMMNDGALQQMAARPPCSTLKLTLVDLQKMRLKTLTEIRDVLKARCISFDAM